jgi:hypothetical protein
VSGGLVAPAAAKPPSNPGVNFLSLPPDTLVATIDGQKVTAAEIQSFLRGMPAMAQRQAMMNATSFLSQFGLFRKLTTLAEEARLDQKSPTKEQLIYTRMVTLVQAELAEQQNNVQITPEDIQKFYDGNPDRYTQAKVKAIFIPFAFNPPQKADPNAKTPFTEAEAKEKAVKVLAEIRAGADFVKMVKEHSQDAASAAKDGDFGTIRRSDRLPEPLKSAVFALKPGEVSEPVRQPTGFYLLRLEELGIQPLEEVKLPITNELKGVKFNEWIQAAQKSIDVRIEYQPLLQQTPVAPGAAVAPPPAAAPVKP